MRHIFVVLVSFLLLAPSETFADEVLIKEGERLKGKVVQAAGGKLDFKSDTVGKVSIGLENVETFSTDEAIKIHFMNGTVFNQKIEASGAGMIRIPGGPAGEMIEYPIADIDKINPPKAKWTGSISAGASFSRGNTYTNSAYASAEAVRRSESDRMRFDAGYVGGRQRDPDTGVTKTTERAAYMGLQYDYFFTKKVYGYGNARAERDAVADIDMRYIAGAGAGWQVVERDDFPDDDSYFAARVAYKLLKKFNSAVTFFHNTTFYPGFTSEGGYLLNTDAGLRSSLTDSMFAEVKAVWTWDSTPAETSTGKAERLDVTYFFSFGWTF
jgi:hypothetical protein